MKTTRLIKHADACSTATASSVITVTMSARKNAITKLGRISVLSSNKITVSDAVYVLWFVSAVPSECKQRVSETHGNEEWIAFVPEKN